MTLTRGELRSLLLFLVLVLGGFVTLGITWHATARTADATVQLPELISGGLSGLGLVVLGGGLVYVQVGRLLAGQRRRAWDELIDDLDGGERS